MKLFKSVIWRCCSRTSFSSRARSSSSEMASSRMILPRDLKAVNETWMVCRWRQSCSSSSFLGLGARAGQ